MKKIGNTKENYKPNDTVLTPKWVFEQLQLQFDLDVAHPPFETNVPCKNYFTEIDDGLNQNWYGLVWMNPPYSKPTPWVDKFIEHNNGIALLPIPRSLWVNKMWESNAAIWLMPYNTKFEYTDGSHRTIWGHTALWALGDQAKAALTNLTGKVR